MVILLSLLHERERWFLPSDDPSRDRECAESRPWVEMLGLRSYWLRERWFVMKYGLNQILLEEMMIIAMRHKRLSKFAA